MIQWRNEPKHLGGGAQSLRGSERSDQARGSVATERWEGGGPPPTVGSFFIFRLENVQSGAYRRKFRRRHSAWHDSTNREKCFFFKESTYNL